MAKVTIKPAVVKVVEAATYTLELSEEEFAALAVLVGSCGGESEDTMWEEVLTPLWDSVFKKYFIDTGMGDSGSLYGKYNKQLRIKPSV